MRKKSLSFVIIIILIIIAISFLVQQVYKIEKEGANKCELRGLDSHCTSRVIQCYDDCKELNKEYLKYDNSGFSSSECWCKLNNSVNQIW